MSLVTTPSAGVDVPSPPFRPGPAGTTSRSAA